MVCANLAGVANVRDTLLGSAVVPAVHLGVLEEFALRDGRLHLLHLLGRVAHSQQGPYEPCAVVTHYVVAARRLRESTVGV